MQNPAPTRARPTLSAPPRGGTLGIEPLQCTQPATLARLRQEATDPRSQLLNRGAGDVWRSWAMRTCRMIDPLPREAWKVGGRARALAFGQEASLAAAAARARGGGGVGRLRRRTV